MTKSRNSRQVYPKGRTQNHRYILGWEQRDFSTQPAHTWKPRNLPSWYRQRHWTWSEWPLTRRKEPRLGPVTSEIDFGEGQRVISLFFIISRSLFGHWFLANDHLPLFFDFFLPLNTASLFSLLLFAIEQWQGYTCRKFWLFVILHVCVSHKKMFPLLQVYNLHT